MLTTWSCREQSDALMSYDHSETLVFSAADTSFAAKFQVMWNGMNQYYAIWDYEAEQGIDWDAVYDEYYPQFEALDQKDTVTDDELKELMDKVFGPLHDGHFYMTVTNHKTGSSVTSNPNMERVLKRPDLEQSMYQPSLQYYANVANGEIETDDNGNPIVIEHTTDTDNLLTVFGTTPGIGAAWIVGQIQELEGKTSRTEMDDFQLQQLSNLFDSMKQVYSSLHGVELVNAYNALQAQYSFLNVPGFDYIDPGFVGGSSVNVKFALLKGNIAYFRLDRFALTTFFDDNKCQSMFNMNNPFTYKHVQAVKQVWQSWFDTVQQLHKNGTLGGVIIDLRGNGGGLMNDSKYVLGSLMPAGKIHFGYQRFKRGTGRYEYSTMMRAEIDAMSDPHQTITEPVVILINCQSGSMSETSSLCLKTMPNGTVIGKPSYGALCPLAGNVDYSFNYSGYIGVQGVTPVFGHVPTIASYTFDRKLIESEGVTPDIEVDLDLDQFKATGKDTQLDRALQFIRTGK